MFEANKSNHFQYNKGLKSFASHNRKNMTKAEACLWKYAIGGKQMMNYQFRRQRSVLNYIADFMCKELLLIIEADGLTHQWEGANEKDQVREQELKKIGFTVLRFSDNEILNDINNVIRTIESYILDFENRKGAI
jgi:very-short-patch-repair endonuclease